MRDQSCEFCRYWLSRPTEEGSTEGLCRRYPPTAHTWVSAARGSTDSVTMAQFPPMDACNWCGEWCAADDAVPPLALEQADVGAIAPPLAAAADEFLPGSESLVFVEAATGADAEATPEPTPEAAAEATDPFDAILQSDDTELWEDAATFGDAEAASDAPPGMDVATEIPPAAVGEETPEDGLPGEPAAAVGEPADQGAEHDEIRTRPDIVLSVGDATEPGGADDAVLVISRRAPDNPHGQAELPDPAEWMKDYPDRSTDGSDPVLARSPAHGDATENGTDEWPDWSEWLESQSDGELRLDRAADQTIADDLPIAEEEAGPGPVPEPPPWLNESQKPKMMSWARRVWR